MFNAVAHTAISGLTKECELPAFYWCHCVDELIPGIHSQIKAVCSVENI